MAKILVADDTPINRQFLSTLLGYGGHAVLEAANGAEALNLVRNDHPDLVIADVLMPVMDGYEFVRQVRSDPRVAGTAVIFYTASYHEHEAQVLAASCGVRHVLTKPAEPAEILSVVSRTLGISEQPNTETPEGFDRDHMRLLTDKLSANANELEATNQRLSDLLEMGRLLASELDGGQLMARFCPAVREMIGGRFAFLGVFTADHVLQPLLVSGLHPEIAARMGPVDPSVGVLAALRESSGPLRIDDVSSDPCLAGLPPPYLTKRSFLGVRLATAAGVYGLLWLLEKLGGAEFSEKDEQVLVSSVAQASIAYENTQRYREIQRHAADLELRVAERTARMHDAINELEAFNYSVAHDLRSPLRHILGFAQMLAEDMGSAIPPEARQNLSMIRQGAQKMGALLNDLLRLSQIGRHDLRADLASLDSIVEEVLRESRPEILDRAIEWKIGALPEMRCDPLLIKQVFINLVSNAVKYSRSRSRAVIEIGAIAGDTGPVFFVRDNGVGFDMKYAGQLFGVFKRLHSQEQFEGTGAGLAIVHRIIRRHHGRIWLESALDQGTTAYFTIGDNAANHNVA